MTRKSCMAYPLEWSSPRTGKTTVGVSSEWHCLSQPPWLRWAEEGCSPRLCQNTPSQLFFGPWHKSETLESERFHHFDLRWWSFRNQGDERIGSSPASLSTPRRGIGIGCQKIVGLMSQSMSSNLMRVWTRTLLEKYSDASISDVCEFQVKNSAKLKK